MVESVAVAGDGDDHVSVVTEPVEQRDGGGLIPEKASSVVEWERCSPRSLTGSFGKQESARR